LIRKGLFLAFEEEKFFMLYVFTFVIIIALIFINGFTDAPNAITTVVSTKVLSFKKAGFLSAIFNVLGIIVMCLVNFKVADCISSIVVLENGNRGLIALSSAMLSVIIFSAVASIFGIPTSETHRISGRVDWLSYCFK
jgi:PiT family inorganic phosphate transporter